MDIIGRIDYFSDNITRISLLRLNKMIRMYLIPRYYGYILYTKTTSLVYDTYKMTLHKSLESLKHYVGTCDKHVGTCDKHMGTCDKHVLRYAKKVVFTTLGRSVVNEFPDLRVYSEFPYIQKRETRFPVNCLQ